MTDIAAPAYALMTAMAFDRLPRARLDELLAEVQARPPFEGYRITITGIPSPTNADKARALRHAHVVWLDASFKARNIEIARTDAHRARPMAASAPDLRAHTRTQGGPKSITHGAEALAIFAAIPACPVWAADPCSCALCTPPQEAASR